MLRRRHKKSFKGCLECRRRHVKCDESRPICKLCTMSGRDCSFASEFLPAENSSTSGSAASPQEPSKYPGLDQPVPAPPSHPQPAAPVAPSFHPNPNSNPPNPSSSTSSPSLNELFSDTLDLDHMELLIHLNLDIADITNSSNWPTGPPICLRTGLAYPYLLQQLLALSTRHLAETTPSATRAASYHHRAVALQTHALMLFNSAGPPTVDRSNCEAVLLFSAVLGHHVLADTLAPRSDAGLPAFVDRYVACVEVHRGIHAVAREAWPLLLETALGPLLAWSSALNNRAPRGAQCAGLADLVSGAPGLDEQDWEDCRAGVRYLQVGFDTILASEEERGRELGNPHEMILSWMILASPRFTALLAARRPEVLVLLAYYALLLHYGRHMWQVGDAGPYILGLIGDYLGPEWDRWLVYPREVMARDHAGGTRSGLGNSAG